MVFSESFTFSGNVVAIIFCEKSHKYFLQCSKPHLPDSSTCDSFLWGYIKAMCTEVTQKPLLSLKLPFKRSSITSILRHFIGSCRILLFVCAISYTIWQPYRTCHNLKPKFCTNDCMFYKVLICTQQFLNNLGFISYSSRIVTLYINIKMTYAYILKFYVHYYTIFKSD